MSCKLSPPTQKGKSRIRDRIDVAIDLQLVIALFQLKIITTKRYDGRILRASTSDGQLIRLQSATGDYITT